MPSPQSALREFPFKTNHPCRFLHSDSDGVSDGCDNCPLDANFDQADTDMDGISDGCDACPTIASGDVNGDTIVDPFDLAPFTQVLLNPAAASAIEYCAADVNGDGTVNGLDVQSLLDVMLVP